ncbi:hypothetical protein LSUE1_G006358 [Lachnellula suecica]|uniref:Uncharacterized protein n=1 Tax=Lachnellula suecica TaxID=602035 RepID=A0A8T9C8P6_9HELO|nr:hypothetical protein LSUE1_G006358 [Lachnellula suecica]
MAAKSQRKYEADVRSWGFSNVFTWSDRRPHSHQGLTTHLILKGQLTITFPKDSDAEKKTYSVGDRVDVDAGRTHEVWVGPEGCTMVIGE